MGLTLAGRNVSRVAWNQSARFLRRVAQYMRRGVKHARETSKDVKAQVHAAAEVSRDAGLTAYAGGVRSSRYWSRVREQTFPRLVRDASIRRELRAVARGTEPIVVGPWLSEVGYEALYWVPFLRWFVHHYRVDPARMVVVSRGGVGSWYADVAGGYVELLDLFTPEEFVRRNAERQARGDQKQTDLSAFDEEILERVRARPGMRRATVCHPRFMFRLLRQFWLGNESLQYALEYLVYRRVAAPVDVPLPSLPSRYAAVKFYSGRALPDIDANRQAVRAIVDRIGADMPIVLLDTGLSLDEHADMTMSGANITTLAAYLTPQNNLAVQTEVIRRAALFIGTCGSVAWLAPMLGTETLAVFADDYLLTPHLYAARHAYRVMDAAAFVPLDLRAAGILSAARAGVPTT
ncbi:MAG: hypothetical protein ABL993_00445 [Vicinamibacterales bacterium]